MATYGAVLSGSGAGVGYVAGALEALVETHVPISVVSGVSSGALCGAMFVSGKLKRFLELCLTLKEQNIYRKKFLGGLWAFLNMSDSVYDSEPLLNLLEREVDFLEVQRSKIQLRILAFDLRIHESVCYTNETLTPRTLLASSSFPGAFPPVYIGSRMLVDGGITNNAPIGAAIKAGAEVIVCIRTTPKTIKATHKDLRGAWSIMKEVAGAEVADNMQNDIDLADCKNNCEEKKHIMRFDIQPDEALGIGTFEIDPEKMEHAIAEGRADALARVEEIMLQGR